MVDFVGNCRMTLGTNQTQVTHVLQIVGANQFRVRFTGQDRLDDAPDALLLQFVGQLVKVGFATQN